MSLEELPVEVAEALSKHKGDITLCDFIIELTAAAAKALAKRKGTINGFATREWLDEL